MDISTTDAMRLLADGLALVYHEARHARHLVKGGFLPSTGWERLLSLPTNRVKAWQAIQAVREDAAKALTPDEAIDLFEKRFGKDLASLGELYANEHWKHAKTVGGHAWRGVTAAVGTLGMAIQRGRVSEIEGAVHSLLSSRHNNGAVRDKIVELDAAVGISTGQWWLSQAGA